MYIFKLFDIEANEHNCVRFEKKPSAMDIVDLLWGVDYRVHQQALNELMEATGDVIYFNTDDVICFNTGDEDGFDDEEDENFREGIYASLTYVPE